VHPADPLSAAVGYQNSDTTFPAGEPATGEAPRPEDAVAAPSLGVALRSQALFGLREATQEQTPQALAR